MPPRREIPTLEESMASLADNMAKLLATSASSTTQLETLSTHLATQNTTTANLVTALARLESEITNPQRQTTTHSSFPPPPNNPLHKSPKILLSTFDGTSPLDWIFQADQYFTFYNIPLEQRVAFFFIVLGLQIVDDGAIHDDFNKSTNGVSRTKNMITGKWNRMHPDCQVHAIYKGITRKSGENDVAFKQKKKLQVSSISPSRIIGWLLAVVDMVGLAGLKGSIGSGSSSGVGNGVNSWASIGADTCGGGAGRESVMFLKTLFSTKSRFLE
ncbi:hypothetical protein Tco_0785717, partial [Tanacetum coccineum]